MKSHFIASFLFLMVSISMNPLTTTASFNCCYLFYGSCSGIVMNSISKQQNENNPYQFLDHNMIESDTIDKWPKEEKDAFIKSCIQNAKSNLAEQQANDYCHCMLEKVIEKYPKPEQATNMTTNDAQKMAKECLE